VISMARRKAATDGVVVDIQKTTDGKHREVNRYNLMYSDCRLPFALYYPALCPPKKPLLQKPQPAK
jgi:hypothetical protein